MSRSATRLAGRRGLPGSTRSLRGPRSDHTRGTPTRVPVRLHRSRVCSVVAELFVPLDRAAFRGEVEQVPDGLERADVARILARLGGCVEELRSPEVADRLAVSMEHVQ